MTHFPRPIPQRRSPRIQLGGSIQAAIRLMDGKRSRGKLQTVSATGGMVTLNSPLADGDFVEIAFQTPAGSVQGMAEMLAPKKQFTLGYHQPFRFVALGDHDHENLCRSLETSNDNELLGFKQDRPARWST